MSKDDYTPSHLREGFDESKVEVIPPHKDHKWTGKGFDNRKMGSTTGFSPDPVPKPRKRKKRKGRGAREWLKQNDPKPKKKNWPGKDDWIAKKREEEFQRKLAVKAKHKQ